jgi:hypothetical protein
MFPASFITIDIGLSCKVRDAGDVADRDFKGHFEGDSDLGRKFGRIFEWKNERARSIGQCNRNERSAVFITISRLHTAPWPLMNHCETFLLPEACRAALGLMQYPVTPTRLIGSLRRIKRLGHGAVGASHLALEVALTVHLLLACLARARPIDLRGYKVAAPFQDRTNPNESTRS